MVFPCSQQNFLSVPLFPRLSVFFFDFGVPCSLFPKISETQLLFPAVFSFCSLFPIILWNVPLIPETPGGN